MPLEHANMDQDFVQSTWVAAGGEAGVRRLGFMNPEQLISRSAFLFLEDEKPRKIDKTRLSTRPTTCYNPWYTEGSTNKSWSW